MCFFFFRQKTAYEMRISDWSSDVCSSDLGIVVVLRRNKPKDRRGKIMLVNASREFRKGNPKNHLTDDAIARIAAAYLKGEPVDGLMAVIDSKQAEANDYNLSPSRYISKGETTAMGESPERGKELAALKKDEAKERK